MAELVREGKVRFLGLSEAAPRRYAAPMPSTRSRRFQTEYSLWSRDPEEKILRAVRALGIGFVPYSRRRGFLTAQIKSIDDLERTTTGVIRHGSGREFFRKTSTRSRDRKHGAGKGLHAGTARAGLGARQGDDIMPIPHEAARVSRRERRRGDVS